jgi:hypothetical protein
MPIFYPGVSINYLQGLIQALTSKLRAELLSRRSRTRQILKSQNLPKGLWKTHG